MREYLITFGIQSWLSFKALYGWLKPKAYILIKLVNPIFQMLFFCLLAKYIYNTSDLTPWVVGNAMLLCVYNTLFGLGSVFINERYYGTLKLIMVSPSNKFMVFMQRGFMHVFDSLITVVLAFVIGALLFNLNLAHVNYLLVFAVLVVSIFAAMGFGLLISSFGLLTTDLNLVLNLAFMILLGVSGANFPIQSLPVVLQKLAYMLPLTRGIEANKLILMNQSIDTLHIVQLITQELLLGLMYIIIGYLLFRITEKISKKKATIDMY